MSQSIPTRLQVRLGEDVGGDLETCLLQPASSPEIAENSDGTLQTPEDSDRPYDHDQRNYTASAPIISNEQDTSNLSKDESPTLRRGDANWLQATSVLLSLQLGWGLWLIPAEFARLGWFTGIGCLLGLAVLTCYSGFLFSRLYNSVPGTVILGDIGYKAAGAFGRNFVYLIIYSLNATRAVVLHLAVAQTLQHIFPTDSRPPIWQCGAVVFVGAGILVQIRSLAQLSWIFSAGASTQLVAVGLMLFELISSPDPDAKHSTQAVSWGTLVPASVAFMNMVFAFGGQFAFIEIMGNMRRPYEFPRAVTTCTTLMAALYAAVGSVGYWSRGEAIDTIVIFSMGDTPHVRFAAALILPQATSQYLVSVNVWTHNLLTLLARAVDETAASKIHCSSDHGPCEWLLTSLFIITYSYAISTTVPYFGTLVGVVTSSTYLLSAYVLPAWFTLTLLGHALGPAERILLWSLIPFAVFFSGVGLYCSILSLIHEIQGGH